MRAWSIGEGRDRGGSGVGGVGVGVDGRVGIGRIG